MNTFNCDTVLALTLRHVLLLSTGVFIRAIMNVPVFQRTKLELNTASEMGCMLDLPHCHWQLLFSRRYYFQKICYAVCNVRSHDEGDISHYRDERNVSLAHYGGDEMPLIDTGF
jgi:hypothetical protein